MKFQYERKEHKSQWRKGKIVSVLTQGSRKNAHRAVQACLQVLSALALDRDEW